MGGTLKHPNNTSEILKMHRRNTDFAILAFLKTLTCVNMIFRFVEVLECVFNISEVLLGCLGVPPMGLRRLIESTLQAHYGWEGAC